MNVLIKTVGFIGDILFASSVASKLVQKGYDEVDYFIGLPQPIELLSNNPHISNVYLEMPNKSYDKVYSLQPIHRKKTPCEQFQEQCEIENSDRCYKVYTNKGLDTWISTLVPKNLIKIAYLSNWEERSFLYTEEQYKQGVDVPYLGYGGKHRNIEKILNILSKNEDFMLIPVGKGNGYNWTNIDQNSVSEYSFTASLLKNCDFFIGAEGGLCNLAAGVGTRTIITGDFIHQLYGWNGVIEKCEEPKLGPRYYFSNDIKHTTLNPYFTDEQVAEHIQQIIRVS